MHSIDTGSYHLLRFIFSGTDLQFVCAYRVSSITPVNTLQQRITTGYAHSVYGSAFACPFIL